MILNYGRTRTLVDRPRNFWLDWLKASISEGGIDAREIMLNRTLHYILINTIAICDER